jgi:hypothetical protein
MSRTLLSLAGFQVILIGRFWVIAEVIVFSIGSKLWAALPPPKDLLCLHQHCIIDSI